MITLVVPFGAESAPISHGDHSFRPYLADPDDPFSWWLVRVTEEAAVHFLHTGGFSLQRHPTRRALSGTMIPVVHADPAAACGWEGEEYAADGNGIFTVPSEAFDDLKSHGFKIYSAEEAEAEEAEKAEKRGPQGERGEPGKQGRKGKPGRRGEQGEQGKDVGGGPFEQGKDGGLGPFEPDPPGTPHPDVPFSEK